MDRLSSTKMGILEKAISKCFDQNPSLFATNKCSQLQEYIMVILGKRKSRIQVRDDLDDFLKDNTEHFVAW